MNLNKIEPWVVILIGPPLSGKTTYIKHNFNNDEYELVSRDQIVLDLSDGADYNKAFKTVDQKEVDRVLINKMRVLGNSNRNVIIDMTHMTRKRRVYNLSFFPNHSKVAIVFPFLSDDEYVMRDIKRSKEEGKAIPMHIVKNMIDSYQPVTKDEGFKKIISL